MNIGSLITLQYDQGQTKAKVGASCNKTDLIRLGSFTSYDLALVFAKEWRTKGADALKRRFSFCIASIQWAKQIEANFTQCAKL